MFTIAPPQSGTLTAVGDTLTYDDQALAADERTAASNTHLFIQEVALARCKSNGVNVGDPDLYRSSTWLDALTCWGAPRTRPSRISWTSGGATSARAAPIPGSA